MQLGKLYILAIFQSSKKKYQIFSNFFKLLHNLMTLIVSDKASERNGDFMLRDLTRPYVKMYICRL